MGKQEIITIIRNSKPEIESRYAVWSRRSSPPSANACSPRFNMSEKDREIADYLADMLAAITAQNR